jgi:hypothetical protein
VTGFAKWGRVQSVMEVWISFSFLEFWPGADIGTLYVTKAVFSSDVGRLGDVILSLIFPFVKVFCLVHP